ncbi:MAG: GTPase [Deltaproteobacteria bacterium]|nr:GTPase [Deltaproteobacteria bacterium]
MGKKVIIMGAAGRDFHNFNTLFKDNPHYRVMAFTAAQIPSVHDRTYPPELAGSLYPEGIPIYPEEDLDALIRDRRVDLVVFSYTDVSHVEVMHKASQVMAAGADFILAGAARTMLRSQKPVIAVCAVRTGCGKSQTTRKICEILRGWGKKTVVVRHPMPYGDLRRQVVQRFAAFEDFSRRQLTIEEREEYEPLVERGIVVYGGVDYREILSRAEQEAEIIVWDGGNNDTPFLRPDIHVVLFDPLRPGHELLYFAGETNLRLADIAIINKVDAAAAGDIELVRQNIAKFAPRADILLATSPVLVSRPERIRGKMVLVVEDGPTLTHGGMAYGAGWVAAKKFGAARIVDPRPFAAGTLREVFEQYPHIGPVLPAMGYNEEQIRDLGDTINNTPCDLILFSTPIQLCRLLSCNKPTIRVRYEYQDYGEPSLEEVLEKRMGASPQFF